MSSRTGAENTPLPGGADDIPDDPRLMQAVQEFLEALEAGQRPDRREFLKRYPDLAGPLTRCLEGLDLVHRGTMPQKPVPPIPAATVAVPGDALPANPLGDFQILKQIGRGGMGIVYEAVQLSLGRKVALKVLPFAATFDSKHLERFYNEAQAAAVLHHTNIVPVFTVGRERGVHYYAMQLIEGPSLADVIHQLRLQAGRQDEDGGPPATASFVAGAEAQAASPNRETAAAVSMALSTQRAARTDAYFRTAARYMVQAAEALEHAHQFGIVHRDIKPANLLLDQHDRIWVTDFGLAQFHSETHLTRTGDILGTLRYMSPEQASGQRTQLDHRADVYSLGATLYELVTLEPIFPGRNRQELLQQIIRDEPRPPRSIDKSIPIELETIILKAVSKSPLDRYNSAGDMAADLQRYLDNKPILARRPSLLERARKWSRRHPSVVAAGLLLLLLCIAGLLVNNRMIAAEQEKTKQALEREQQRAEEAELRLRQARKAVDLLVQVSEEELPDQMHLQGLRRRLLETALAYYQDFIEQQPADRRSQADLEAGRNRLRKILDDLSTLQGAHQLVLAAKPDVQADLKLNKEQRDKITHLADRSREEFLTHFRDQRRRGVEENRQRFLEMARANEKVLAVLLDAGQLDRLKQITLQLQGPMAFDESRVIDALQLTAEQNQKIREILRERPRFGFEKGQQNQKKRHEIFQDMMRGQTARILALLTPVQVDRWQALIGPRFEGEHHFLPFGPPPFGPRPVR